jgi:hypothetical protein
MALPGEYAVVMEYAGKKKERNFKVAKDPRSTATDADLDAQFTFIKEVQEKVSEAHQAIIDLRKVKTQVNDFQGGLDKEAAKEVIAYGDSLVSRLEEVEKALYQTKNRSGQDPLNYPIQLTNKLAHLNSLVGIGSFRPTEQSYTLKTELTAKVDAELAKYRETLEQMIPAYNRMVREAELDLISVPKVE